MNHDFRHEFLYMKNIVRTYMNSTWRGTQVGIQVDLESHSPGAVQLESQGCLHDSESKKV